jgi:2-keto-3-deoxy-L-rhamnonate aldolase RhmA
LVKANEVVRNIVKEKLARDEVVASMTIRLVRGVEIARMAATAGFDMIYIDLEHSTLTLESTGQICQAALSAGVTPMVRVPANTPEYIQRVLDAGALGIIAPGVRSAEEARAVVAAAKFAPLGERGAGGALPHLEFRPFPTAEANAAVNDATMVIVQFECAEAVEKAEEIAAVEGVDMVLIGVNDLLADWDWRASSNTRRCVRPMRGPSKPVASTVNMSASAASRPGRSSLPNSSPLVRACSRPEPTFSFCSQR